MPIYLLNIHDAKAREDLIILKDFDSLIQNGLLVEADNEEAARDYAAKHHNTKVPKQKEINAEEKSLRANYSTIWNNPNISTVHEVSSL